MIITAKTTSEEELTLLTEQMDGWNVEDELQVETTTHGFVCRFEFPGGDPRADKVLTYLQANAAAWEPMKNAADAAT